jgi:hypothetical protein
VGFIALCYRFIYLAQRPDFPHASVPQATPLNEAWAISTVWSLGPAVHVIFVGLVLVLVFALRLALRVSSLSVCLTPLGHAVPDHEAVWQHILVFVWISIVCISAINGVTSALLWGFHSLITRFLHFRSFPPQLAGTDYCGLNRLSRGHCCVGRWRTTLDGFASIHSSPRD